MKTDQRSAAGRLLLALVCACLMSSQASAQNAGRPQVQLQCQSYGTGPLLECVVELQRRDGSALEGAQVMLGALMPSMPMAHTVKPVKAQPTAKPGQYKGTLELEMLGVWAVEVDLSGPVRDKQSRNLVVHECEGNARCAATPARAADLSPARPGDRHRH